MTSSSTAASIAGVTLALLTASSLADSPPEMSVRDLMVQVINPAANTLRAVAAPETDAAWQELAEAAELVIRALQSVKDGGAGPKDAMWASEAAWDQYADTVIAVAADALAAINSRNVEALSAANEALHPPCEACHLDYLPGIDPESDAD